MKKLVTILIVFFLKVEIAIANEIPEMYHLVAVENSVPTKLFYALILNESRTLTKHRNKNRVLPWPWAINYKGNSYYFENRYMAYLFAKSLVEKNDKRFDIGLGQLNWYWQEKKFKNLWDAFEPYENLTVAAKILREQYDRRDCNNWEDAVGFYHRPAQSQADKLIASRYKRKVIKIWEEL